jgi:hypothetical protein
METAHPALETRRVCEDFHRGAIQKFKMTAASTAAILRQFPKFQKKIFPEIPEEILPKISLPLGDKQDDIDPTK